MIGTAFSNMYGLSLGWVESQGGGVNWIIKGKDGVIGNIQTHNKHTD
jgi:hypothetical protein